MKLVFIHLSDLHINEKTRISNKKIEKLADTLNTVEEISDIYIICTGDLAYSGNKNEYRNVEYFFRKLLREMKRVINDKYINIYAVPGNHDIQINSNNSFLELSKESLKLELDRMNDFFDFAKSNKKYKILSKENCDINSLNENYGNKKYKLCVNLINTAPFSSLQYDDKERHYIYPENLSKIKSDGDLNIIAMHHSYEWFNNDIRLDLKHKICTNDILFLGHEHYQDIYSEEYSNNGLIVSRAGAFDPDDYNNNSYFNMLTYDINEKYVDIVECSWNKNSQIFTIDKRKQQQIIRCFEKFKYSDEFTERILKDEKINICKNINDYFVFPDLRKEEDNQNIKITSIEALLKNIKTNRIVSISGKNDSGRTILLKHLYMSIRKDKFALYLNANDMNNKKIRKIIDTAILEQIEESHSFDKYHQLPREEKVIFIDDFDAVDEPEARFKLLKYLQQYFDNIVISSLSDAVVNLKEEIKDKFELDIKNIKINRFTKKQRDEILRKISHIHNYQFDENILVEIDRNIKNTPLLSMLGNTFTLNYLNMIVVNGNLYSNSGKENFSVLFEQTLRSSIIDHTNVNDIEAYLKVLELIGYKAHTDKQGVFNIQFVSDVISDYNDEYGKRISTTKFINKMTETCIFTEEDIDYYSFANRMYLAYFVAKNIYFEIMNFNNDTAFKMILKNICFGINGDILLFLIYISQNMQLIEYIYENTIKICEEWDEFSFDQKNISFLYRYASTPKKFEKIEDEDILEIRDAEVEEEIRHFEDYNITCEGIYDYSEDEVDKEINQLTCLMKLTELLARGLNSFNASMRMQQKLRLIEAIYTSTNKFLYKILAEFDKDFENCIDFLSESNQEADKSKIAISIVNFLTIFIYSYYYRNISLCTSSQTYDVIVKFLKFEYNPKGIDEDLKNRSLFNLIVLNNTNKNDKFNRCLNEILDKAEDEVIMKIIQILLTQRFIIRDISERERSKMIDNYNNKVNKKYSINKHKVKMGRIYAIHSR